MATAMAQPPSRIREAEAPTNSPSDHGDDLANWERTRRAEERLPSIQREDGRFKGREIIHRDSRIDGGVCLGAHGREAIVVDWRHHASPGTAKSLASLYDEALRRATDDRGFRRNLALQAVYDTVNEHFLDRSPSGVDRVNAFVGARPDDKVHIDCYISARAGVCRHMALVCAAMLERMVDEGLLRGKVSNDRNSIAGVGAHAWCRYTSSSGDVVILDPMQGYFGKLEEAPRSGGWKYARPNEGNRAA